MKNSHIQWCHHTFNPWEGCTKVSPGCAHCYAETRNARFGGGTAPNWGKGAPRRRTSVHNWNEPPRWNAAEARALEKYGPRPAHIPRPRVFCASLADWLDDEVPVEWLADLLNLIEATPHLDWLLLTKRPDNWQARMEAVRLIDGDSIAWSWLRGNAPANVWIGTTMEDQPRVVERLPWLLSIPAQVRFVSAEPMLAPLDLRLKCNGHDLQRTVGEDLHWVIIGGESGADARPFHTEHAWDLLLQCRAAGVAPFVKQLGANPFTSNANAMAWPDTTEFLEIEGGIEAAGASVELRDKKGADMAEWPEELRVREFPK